MYTNAGRLTSRVDDDANCPSWCTRHATNDDKFAEKVTISHETTITVGTAEITVSMDEGDPDGTVVWVPQLDWVNGQELEDLAAAFAQAAALIREQPSITHVQRAGLLKTSSLENIFVRAAAAVMSFFGRPFARREKDGFQTGYRIGHRAGVREGAKAVSRG